MTDALIFTINEHNYLVSQQPQAGHFPSLTFLEIINRLATNNLPKQRLMNTTYTLGIDLNKNNSVVSDACTNKTHKCTIFPIKHAHGIMSSVASSDTLNLPILFMALEQS